MTAFCIILSIILMVTLYKLKRINDSVNDLKRRIFLLENNGTASTKTPVTKTEKATTETIAAESIKSAQQKKPEQVIKKAIEPAAIKVDFPAPQVKPAPTPKRHDLAEKFAANWTGIVGAIIMIMGVGFFSIYAALRMSSFFRFSLVLILGLAIWGISLWLQHNQRWEKAVLWLRSSAGAILLLATTGASAVPPLHWVDNQWGALALIVSGIAFNLYCAWRSGHQLFASLHVVLSLIVLAIIPQEPLILGIGALIIIFGLILTIRANWDYHQLIILTASFGFQLSWFYRSSYHVATIIPLEIKIFAGGIAIAITLLAALTHYRERYSDRRFVAPALAAHILNWLFLGVILHNYTTGTKWNTIIIALSAIIIFFNARRARKQNINWLYLCDTLVSQMIALIAIYTLKSWQFDAPAITIILLAESVIFTAVAVLEKSKVLTRTGFILQYFFQFVLAITLLNAFDLHPHSTRLIVLTIASLFITALAHFLGQRDDAENLLGLPLSGGSLFTISGLLLFIWPSILYFAMIDKAYGGYIVAALVIVMLILGRFIASQSANVGMLTAIIIIELVGWIHTGKSDFTSGKIITATMPLIAMPAVNILCNYNIKKNRYTSWPGIYLLTANFMLQAYFLPANSSPFISGVCWLLIGLAALVLSDISTKRGAESQIRGGNSALHLEISGIICNIAFFVRYIFVYLQSEGLIGSFKVRLLLELFALVIFFYWALSSVDINKYFRKQFIFIRQFYWEAFLIFAVITIFTEISTNWLPCALTILGTLLYICGQKWKTISRWQIYALASMLYASVHIAFVSSTSVTPSVRLLDQGWVAVMITLLLMIVLTCYIYLQNNFNSFPEDKFKPVARLAGLISKHPAIWLFYPLFITTALFLFWSFDSALLTLLWVCEAFIIFSLSLILRESHFRYLSMIALGGCLIRLIFFDLSQSGYITRAVVFFGVGVIMIAINLLYTKFSERLK